MGQIVWSSSSNGTIANSSQVTASIQVRKTNNTTQSTTGTWTGYLSINNDKRNFSIRKEVSKNSWVTLLSFTITKAHNSDGTAICNIQGKIQGPAGTSQASSIVTANKNVTLDKIDRYATITSVNNFNDEQNPVIYFSNPAGFNLQFKIEAGGNVNFITRDNIVNPSSPFVLALTDNERQRLRALIPNSNSLTVRITVGTYINGNVVSWSYLDRLMTITNANPTFSQSYLDTNNTTTAITNNNQQIIQNNSTLQINISNAQAKKSATLVSASANVNGNITTENFSSGSSTLTLNIGTVDVSQNLNIPITVTDSRGNKTTNNISVTILAWSLPTAIITLARVSNFYTETNLKVNADYSSLDNNNTITIQYQIKKTTDTSYSSLVTIQDNIQTQFQADNNYSWNVKVILTDRIGTTTYNLLLYKGIPLMFFDKLLSSIGVNCFPEKEYSIESSGLGVDDVIYVGSQVLYENYQMTTATKQAILGSYGYDLIQGLFHGIEIPTAYVKAYRITAQISTSNNNQASIWLNDIQSNTGNTWSNPSMRKIISTRIFKESEITLEPTFNYTSRDGTNLYCQNSGPYQANFWNITVHAYLVKNTTNLLNLNTYSYIGLN